MTIEQAKARYVHRFTAEHVPMWARQRRADGTFYAPHYISDAEWFANTLFPPNNPLGRKETSCFSSNQTWPLGKSLPVPFSR